MQDDRAVRAVPATDLFRQLPPHGLLPARHGDDDQRARRAQPVHLLLGDAAARSDEHQDRWAHVHFGHRSQLRAAQRGRQLGGAAEPPHPDPQRTARDEVEVFLRDRIAQRRPSTPCSASSPPSHRPSALPKPPGCWPLWRP
ncbi:hypothetical protein [Saccharopolyspora sp. 5N708]|uniref:hypothetical protein n=1 Tax=Saccharopolyspora sp. 5N708 TaxID=3457424 RepID=UPI003FD3C762